MKRVLMLIITLVLLMLPLVLTNTFGYCEFSCPWPTYGWEHSTPEEQGMDSRVMVKVLSVLKGNAFHSFLIARHGYIVAEAYYPGYDEYTKHPVFSCTKSVISALVGIAIEEGHIKSIDQKILEFFPEYKIENQSAWKESVTIRHLLTMSDGFDLSEENYQKWKESPDKVGYFLNLPVSFEPGTKWRYHSAGAHLLSAIIQKTTGKTTLEYATEHLFTSLNIKNFEWPADEQGINWGGSNLKLTTRDMAKFGYLYLRKGQWEGKQLVPAQWVADSGEKHAKPDSGEGYGYLWWINYIGFAQGMSASGYKNQYIIVVPKYDLVAVFTSWMDDYGIAPRTVWNLFKAIKSDGPIRENPKGDAKLDQLIKELTQS